MKKMIPAIALISIGTFSQAFAKATDNIVISKKPIKEIYEDSSEANRLDKKAIVTLGLTGLGPNLSNGNTLSAGMYLSHNQLILVEYTGGKSNASRGYTESINGITTAEGKSESQSKQLGAHYKQFISNSFYFRGGLDYNQVDYKYDIRSSTTSRNMQSDFSGQALVGNLTIGNQWQWQNFTMGCDWVGLASPLVTKINSRNISANATEQNKADFEEDQKLYLTGGSLIALRFYLGVSF